MRAVHHVKAYYLSGLLDHPSKVGRAAALKVTNDTNVSDSPRMNMLSALAKKTRPLAQSFDSARLEQSYGNFEVSATDS